MSRKKKAEDYGITLRSRIKLLRVENDLTQDDLALKLGVTRQTISAIEKGKYNPSLILAYKIANLFGKSIEEVFQFLDFQDGP